MDCNRSELLVHCQLSSLLKLISIESVMPSTISPSVIPFSSCLQSFPASGPFPMSQLFASGGQSIGLSASTSVFPMNTQDFRMDWLDLLAVQGTLRSLLQNYSSKASNLQHSDFFIVQISHPYMTNGKIMVLTRRTFSRKVMLLLFNMLSWFVTAFFPKEWPSFNFKAAVIICSDFGAQENEVCHCFHCFPIYLLWIDGTGWHHTWCYFYPLPIIVDVISTLPDTRSKILASVLIS